jgi:hypothetical protein
MANAQVEGLPPAAQVRISRVYIRGLRCVEDLVVDLEPTTTYVVGENNTGKATLLMGISAALGRHRLSIDDLTRKTDGTVVDKAEVDLIVVPSHDDTFGTHERGALGANVYRVQGQLNEFAGIRAVFSPSREGGQLIVQRSFLQPGRQDLIASPSEFIGSALGLFECELLDASRDLVNDLGSRSSRWGRVLFDLQIPELPNTDGEPDPLSRSALEGA